MFWANTTYTRLCHSTSHGNFPIFFVFKFIFRFFLTNIFPIFLVRSIFFTFFAFAQLVFSIFFCIVQFLMRFFHIWCISYELIFFENSVIFCSLFMAKKILTSTEFYLNSLKCLLEKGLGRKRREGELFKEIYCIF